MKRATGGTRATALLDRQGVAYATHAYHHDPRAGSSSATSYGDEAAHALGVDPSRIFKTLIALVDTTPMCAVVPVAGRLDLKALAGVVGAKRAEMAEPALASRLTGYVVGGISPIGLRTAVPVFLDASAESFETVYVSAGKRGLQLELAPDALLAAAGATLARLAIR